MSADDKFEEFARKQLNLIALEQKYEVEEQAALIAQSAPLVLQARGYALLDLEVGSIGTGMGGRTLVRLQTQKNNGILPATKFGTGDIVRISVAVADESKDKAKGKKTTGAGPVTPVCDGVVARVTETEISVAVNDYPDDGIEGRVRLDRLANEITYKRLSEAMNLLSDAKTRSGPASNLRNALFGVKPLAFGPTPEITPFNTLLNGDQLEAVKFALSAQDVALIHGPPGTGKTSTVIEYIRQELKARPAARILACADSNIAVDNMTELLAPTGIRIARLGHPARLSPRIVAHSLDALIAESDGAQLVRDVKQEISALQDTAKRTRNKQERRQAWRDVKELYKELRNREARAVADVVAQTQVVLTTNSGAAGNKIKGMVFDVVVIDECAQATEASCWIPLLKGKKAVLAGDHRQLPPTIMNEDAARQGLARTLFERIMESFPGVSRLLPTQYRMNELIMTWASRAMYEGRLVAGEGNKQRLLTDLAGVTSSGEDDVVSVPLVFVDTAGCGMEESGEAISESKSNEGEANVAEAYVRRLLAAGVDPKDIGLITPYNAQVALLRLRLSAEYPTLLVGTVDSFQGSEREAIVISMVRSNADGEIGFLSDDRRNNVAITRAKRHVAVIGDSDTMSQHAFLKGVVDYFSECGDYRSAAEFVST